jgi:hypothetical protein
MNGMVAADDELCSEGKTLTMKTFCHQGGKNKNFCFLGDFQSFFTVRWMVG